MPICIVIFTYNRWQNLRLVLRSLKEQTTPRSEFHVVVADDGSTDGTVEEVHGMSHFPEWEGRLHLVSGGPHHGARITRINNIGISNVPLECSLAVVVDGDICMAPDAVERIVQLHSQHPEAVIMTSLDWLPPMTHSEIENIWDAEGFESLFNYVPDHLMRWMNHTLVGKESRPLPNTAKLEPLDTTIFHQIYALPTKIFWQAGGYDEDMRGYGFQQLELAIRLEAQNVSMLATTEIRALHIWHPKDPEVSEAVPWQRQKNTDYMLRKHPPHGNPLSYRDWRYWRHYHRTHGGMVAYCVEGQVGLYALNKERTHYLRLPHAGWLYPLGFSTGDIVFVDQHALISATNMGEATDPLNECDFLPLIDDLNTMLADRLSKWRVAQSTAIGVDIPKSAHDLESLFFVYDMTRARADKLPGARLPVIGFPIRLLGRIIFAGKVWAAERQLLRGLLDNISI